MLPNNTAAREAADRWERHIRAAEQNLKQGYRLIHRDGSFLWVHETRATLEESAKNVRSIVETFLHEWGHRFTGVDVIAALGWDDPVPEAKPPVQAAAPGPKPQIPGAAELAPGWYLLTELTDLIGANQYLLRDWRSARKITARKGKAGRVEVLLDAALVDKLARQGIHVRLTDAAPAAAAIEPPAAAADPKDAAGKAEDAAVTVEAAMLQRSAAASGDGAEEVLAGLRLTHAPDVLPWELPPDAPAEAPSVTADDGADGEAELPGDDEDEALERLHRAEAEHNAARLAVLQLAERHRVRAERLMEAAGR